MARFRVDIQVNPPCPMCGVTRGKVGSLTAKLAISELKNLHLQLALLKAQGKTGGFTPEMLAAAESALQDEVQALLGSSLGISPDPVEDEA